MPAAHPAAHVSRVSRACVPNRGRWCDQLGTSWSSEPSPGADVAGVSPVPAQTWTHLLVERVHRQLRRRLDPLLNRVGDVRHDLSADEPPPRHAAQRSRAGACGCQRLSLPHATCNVQPATYQMAACNTQHATYGTQHVTHNNGTRTMQHTACNSQDRATHNI